MSAPWLRAKLLRLGTPRWLTGGPTAPIEQHTPPGICRYCGEATGSTLTMCGQCRRLKKV